MARVSPSAEHQRPETAVSNRTEEILWNEARRQELLRGNQTSTFRCARARTTGNVNKNISIRQSKRDPNHIYIGATTIQPYGLEETDDEAVKKQRVECLLGLAKEFLNEPLKTPASLNQAIKVVLEGEKSIFDMKNNYEEQYKKSMLYVGIQRNAAGIYGTHLAMTGGDNERIGLIRNMGPHAFEWIDSFSEIDSSISHKISMLCALQRGVTLADVFSGPRYDNNGKRFTDMYQKNGDPDLTLVSNLLRDVHRFLYSFTDGGKEGIENTFNIKIDMDKIQKFSAPFAITYAAVPAWNLLKSEEQKKNFQEGKFKEILTSFELRSFLKSSEYVFFMVNEKSKAQLSAATYSTINAFMGLDKIRKSCEKLNKIDLALKEKNITKSNQLAYEKEKSKIKDQIKLYATNSYCSSLSVMNRILKMYRRIGEDRSIKEIKQHVDEKMKAIIKESKVVERSNVYS